MFIYNKFSTLGVANAEKVIHLLANEGIKGVCLVDEFGLGISSFLKISKRRKIHVSIAVPFSSFFEGKEEKTEGYFITSNYGKFKQIKKLLAEIKSEYIPFISHKDVEKLGNDVYCFLEEKNTYREIHLDCCVRIHPISTLSQEEETTENEGTSLEKSFQYTEAVVFIEGISKSASDFLSEYESDNKCVDLSLYSEQKKEFEKSSLQNKRNAQP